jgi:hypothetical protein
VDGSRPGPLPESIVSDVYTTSTNLLSQCSSDYIDINDICLLTYINSLLAYIPTYLIIRRGVGYRNADDGGMGIGHKQSVGY